MQQNELLVKQAQKHMRIYINDLIQKDGERDIYKLTKAREIKTRDLNQVKCIKDENQNVLVNEGGIKERWNEYFAKLFNNGADTRVRLGHLSNFEGNASYTFYRRISSKEIRQVLKKIKKS